MTGHSDSGRPLSSGANSVKDTSARLSAGKLQPPPHTIEIWETSRLKADPRNARKHPPEQIKQLRALVKTYGPIWPVLVRENGLIIAGHGRLEAIIAEGFNEVRVIVAHGWTEEQCRTFALADNQVALNAQWDRDMLGVELRELRELGADISLTGFSQKELERLTSGSNDPGPGFTLESAYQILIECADEAEQLKLLGRLRAENVKCRALIA